jgi:hypothetical protein
VTTLAMGMLGGLDANTGDPQAGLSLPGGVRLVVTWTHTGCHQLNVF